jgi:hypothetical protein
MDNFLSVKLYVGCMSKALKSLGIAVLIIGLVLSATMFLYKFPTATQVPYQVQVPYQDTVTQTQTLDHRENYQIAAGGYAYSNFTLESGKTWVVTWQTDSPVSVYILNPSQYSTVQLLGVPITALASQSSTPSGSLSYQIPQDGFYYIVITNPNGLQNVVNVAAYKSELQWQEQVTKYRTETDYRTETIYTSSAFGINLGISVIVLGSLLTALSFVNLKPIVIKTKKLKHVNEVTCDYCNTIYKKSIDKCPNCGARKKST